MPPGDNSILIGIRIARACGSGIRIDVLASSIKHAKAVNLEGRLGRGNILPDGSEIGVGAQYFPNGAAAQEIARINPAAKIEGGFDRVISEMRLKKAGSEISNLRGAI